VRTLRWSGLKCQAESYLRSTFNRRDGRPWDVTFGRAHHPALRFVS
jgi:hypothetical protein